MIESIKIANTASYGSTHETIDNLKKVNYFFGSNGTGKSTIARVIANEDSHEHCTIKWKNNAKLQAAVYNREFVEKNFNQSSEIRGIFTLGEDNIMIIEKIKNLKKEFNEQKIKYEKTENDILKFKEDSQKIEQILKEKCWVQRTKHEKKFKSAFEGFQKSKEIFKDKIISEKNNNTSQLVTLEELEKKAETIYGTTPTNITLISIPETLKIIGHTSNPILKKHVIGKTDVDIAEMIQKLGNSDWVRQGRLFYNKNDQACPFCQQTTTDEFAKSLNDYFDETFEKDNKAINELLTNYKNDTEQFKHEINTISASLNKFIATDKLKTLQATLNTIITTNIQRLITKQKEPSQIIVLEPITDAISELQSLIQNANMLITQHNNMISNLAQEKRNLTSQIWKYLIEVELKIDIEAYEKDKALPTKIINNMSLQIENIKRNQKLKIEEIKNLGKKVTSIEPTISKINELLLSVNFKGFTVAESNKENYYKLVRKDGTDVKDTLSEGEKSFISFLYFYHLLDGSEIEGEITNDRVVVFDDPVSSLDSDILYIVGNLIKTIFDKIRSDKHIKQCFVLTHNVYFHKEITYNPKYPTDESFWVIRKSDVSTIKNYLSNPVKSSYAWLWYELKNQSGSVVSIQNIMRRIIENYFYIIGGMEQEQIRNKLIGADQVIYKSLISWINDGSHSIYDDVSISIQDTTIDNYQRVFKTIFEKTGHIEHYNMMINNPEVKC